MRFCLQHARQAPVAERVSLYRGLADFCGDAHEAALLQRAADALESADRLTLSLDTILHRP